MADTTIDLLKNSSYVGKMDELIAAVKLGGSATSDVEWDNVKNKPTTIGGYGIIDAKIDNGTITLGNQTITPLTSAPVTSVNSKTGAVTLSAADVSAIPSTLTGTAGQVLTKTSDGQEWKDVDIPTALPNPNALTFTGAATGRYDGSEAKTINIPSGGGAAVYSKTTLTEAVSSVEFSLDGASEFSLALEVPVVEENMTYCYALVNGKQSGFKNLNIGSTSTKVFSFFTIKRVGEGIWFIRNKAGNGNIYENGTFGATEDIPINNGSIMVEIETYGIKCYGSQQLPIGTNIYTIKGGAAL